MTAQLRKPYLSANLAEQLMSDAELHQAPATVTVQVPAGTTVTVVVSAAPAVAEKA